MKGALILSILYILFCLLTFKHFGITSDEYVEYQSGKALLHYYQTGNQAKNFNISARHLPENSTYFRGHLALFSYLNPKGYYETYHLFNMLFALPIFLMFYALLLATYKSQKIAGIGTLVLFLTPRFLGDLPANPKDVPFALFYFLGLGAIFLSNKYKPNALLKVLLLGVLIGLTLTFRLVGASLFIILFFYQARKSPVEALRDVALSLLVALFVLVVSLPLFSQGAVVGIKTLVESSSNFEYWNNKMLFMSNFLTKEQRPFYYLPVWLIITTPVYQVLLLVVAPFLVYFNRVRNKELYGLFSFSLLISLLTYFLISPVIYNGLRHFLFLLPLVSFVSTLALVDLALYIKTLPLKIKVTSAILTVILFLVTVTNITKSHPYEYIYFNEFTGGLKGAIGKYDTDYWGASYKEMTEWVLKNPAKTSSINVYTCDKPFAVSYYSKKLLQIVSDESEADYIMCDTDNAIQKRYMLPEVFSVVRGGAKIGSVFDSNSLKK